MTGALATVPEVKDPRELALLKAVGLERVAPEQRELALHIAARYDLDLMLKHLVLIEGRPYITRDGLLHIAHRSGVLDGIEVTTPEVVDGFWRCTASVYRKDMSRPFTYPGRYPTQGGNQKYAPEMVIKTCESMALRRAFDISAPTQDERWDTHDLPTPVEAAPKPTLAQRVAEKAAEVTAEPDAEVVTIASGVSYDFREPPVADDAEPEPADAPHGLTVAGFRDAMAAAHVAPDFVKSVRSEMFPTAKTVGDLTDDERGRLADEILR